VSYWQASIIGLSKAEILLVRIPPKVTDYCIAKQHNAIYSAHYA